MLAEFFDWWTRQCVSLFPSASGLDSADDASGLTIKLGFVGAVLDSPMEILSDGQAAVMLPFNREGLARLHAMPFARRRPLRLMLPSGTILERKVTLPAAVECDLPQVLHYEMDRLTPFAAADVLWDWTLTRHDKRHGKLDIRLYLVKRELVAPALGLLQEHGLPPDYLESHGSQAGSSSRILWLKRETVAGSRQNPMRLVAVALCGILALALCATPFLRQQMTLSAIERQIAALQPSVTAAAALLRNIEADAQSNVIITRERRAAGNPLEVLAAVTDALPDGTWLTELSLQRRALHLEGEGHAAAQLIGRLAAVNRISDPAFAAPVTSDTDRHTDVFAISAEVQP